MPIKFAGTAALLCVLLFYSARPVPVPFPGAARAEAEPPGPAPENEEVLAEGKEGPLVTRESFARELLSLPPPLRESLPRSQRAELLETLVGRLLVAREVAAAGEDTDPVQLARLAAAETVALLRAFVLRLERERRTTGEAELRAEYERLPAAERGSRTFDGMREELADRLAARRVEAELDRRYREFLDRDPARTEEAELLFDRMLGTPDAALGARRLFSFRNAPPFTLLDAYGIFDLARAREGATLETARRDRTAWLERFLKTAVVRALARAQRAHEEPQFLEETRRTTENLRNAWYARRNLPEPSAVTEEEIRSFHEMNPSLFRSGGETRVFLIQATSETACREIRAALLAGAPFDRVARERSVHESASRGGDLGFLRPDAELADPLREAFDLEPGALSEAIPAGDGFYLLKAAARTPERAVPLEAVRDRIRTLLAREKGEAERRELFERLKAKHGVRTHPDRVK